MYNIIFLAHRVKTNWSTVWLKNCSLTNQNDTEDILKFVPAMQRNELCRYTKLYI